MTTATRLAPLVLALAGCAEVLDIPPDPELVTLGPWGCLAEPRERPLPLAATARVLIQACDFVTDCVTPVTGLVGRLCAKSDIGCVDPLQTGLIDSSGLFSIDVPTGDEGFDGYLEVTSATAPCTGAAFGAYGPILCGLEPDCHPEAPDEHCAMPIYVRSLLYFNPPIVSDSIGPQPLPLLAAAAIPTLVQAAGTNLDPTTGNLFITAVDCDGAPAAGVSYSIDADPDLVTQLYMHGGAVSDTNLQTDDSGLGGFLGVPPGIAEVQGYNRRYQKVGVIGVQTEPFTVTYSALAPVPEPAPEPESVPEPAPAPEP